MSHNKRIETSRECRLWIATGMGIITTAILVASDPVVRHFVGTTVEDIKWETKRVVEKIKNKREERKQKNDKKES